MKEKVLSKYKNILDNLKIILTYIAVFSAITIIFGGLHILGYLYAGDHLWLINTIKYSTLISWGMPLVIIFAIAWSIIISTHVMFDFKNSSIVILVGITILFVLLLFFKENNYVDKLIISYILFFGTSILLSINIGRTINENVIKLKMNIMIFISILLLITLIFTLGNREYKDLNDNLKAKFNNKEWDILINNSDSFILLDKDNNITKIVNNEDIEYFKKSSK